MYLLSRQSFIKKLVLGTKMSTFRFRLSTSFKLINFCQVDLKDSLNVLNICF